MRQLLLCLAFAWLLVASTFAISVTVTTPASGSTIYIGSQVTLAFTLTDAAFPVSINLYKGATLETAITTAPLPAGSTSFVWTVPGVSDTNVAYHLKFTDANSNSTDSATFNVKAPTINVAQPSAGATWTIGEENKFISWTVVGPVIGSLNIELIDTSDASNTLAVVSGLDKNSVNYTWPLIPNTISALKTFTPKNANSFRLRFTDTGNAGLVTQPTTFILRPLFTFTLPGATPTVGGATTFTYSRLVTPVNVTSVSVALYSEDVLHAVLNSNLVHTASGSVTVNIPTNVLQGSNYRYAFVNSATNVVYALSPVFQIASSTTKSISGVTVTGTPTKGNTLSISWTATGITKISVDLYFKDTHMMNVAKLSGVSSYSWTVPNSVLNGNLYKILVSDADNSKIFSSSSNLNILDLTVTITSVSAPAANQIVFEKDLTKVTWTTNSNFPAAGMVNIDLYADNGNTFVTSVARGLTNTAGTNGGSFDWKAPAYNAARNNYLLSVYLGTSTVVVARSGVFNITQPQSFTTPSGNFGLGASHPDNFRQAWKITVAEGSCARVQFTSFGFPDTNDKVTVYMGENNDAELINSYTDSLRPSWIQSTSNTLYFLFTANAGGAAGLGFAANYSTVPCDAPSVTVLRPFDQLYYTYGSTISISWRTTGYIPWVTVSLITGTDTLVRTIKPTIANNREAGSITSETYEVPSDLEERSDYRIRVMATNPNIVYGLSPTFRIAAAPNITVIQPVLNLAWYTGNCYPVQWSTRGDISSVFVDILNTANNARFTVGGPFSNSGYETVCIPSSVPITLGAQMKVVVYSNSTGIEFKGESQMMSVTAPCGQTINGDNGNIQITTTNYKHNATCTWAMANPTANNCYRFTVNSNTLASGDEIVIYEGTSAGNAIIARINSTTANGFVITSAVEEVLVSFKTNDQVLGTGITLAYVSVQCASTISVITPSRYTRWRDSLSYVIEWTSSGAAGLSPVHIQLWNRTSNVKLSDIANNVVNPNGLVGHHEWTVPAELSTAGSPVNEKDYEIRVVSSTNAFKYSKAAFTVFDETQQYIAVTTPKRPGKVDAGGSYTISWTRSGTATARVNIMLYSGDVFLENIATNVDTTAANNQYVWNVRPNMVHADNYRVYVMSTTAMSIYGESSTFAISTEPASTITISSPTGSQNIKFGDTVNIQWATTGPVYTVNILLYNHDIFYTTLQSSYPNNGSFVWTVPLNTLSQSLNYTVLVVDVNTTRTVAISNKFPILGSYDLSLAITSPVKSSVLTVGEPESITWSWSGIIHTVDIDLYSADSASSIRIATAVTNNGHYNWTVPRTLLVSDSYVIRITAAGQTYNSVAFTIAQPAALIPTVGTINSITTASTVAITWASGNVGYGYVDIELYNGKQWYLRIAERVSNTGSFDFVVPNDLIHGSDYRIYVFSSASRAVVALSKNFDVVASATNAGITASFSTNEAITGAEYTVTWTWPAAGMISASRNPAVDVDLYLAASPLSNSTFVRRVAANLPNTNGARSYKWVVPASTRDRDTLYVLRVSSSNSTFFHAFSTTFKILPDCSAVITETAGVIKLPNTNNQRITCRYTFINPRDLCYQFSPVSIGGLDANDVITIYDGITENDRVISKLVKGLGNQVYSSGKAMLVVADIQTSAETTVAVASTNCFLPQARFLYPDYSAEHALYNTAKTTIRWTTTEQASPFVDIQIRNDANTYSETIASSIPNDGAFVWNGRRSDNGQVPLGRYMFIIRSSNSGSKGNMANRVLAYSNFFTLRGVIGISLTANTYAVGDTITVSVSTSASSAGNVDIDWVNDANQVIKDILSAVTIPRTLNTPMPQTTERLRVRVKPVAGNNAYETTYSETYVYPRETSVTRVSAVSRPVDATISRYAVGETWPIRWSTESYAKFSAVDIYVTFTNGTVVGTLSGIPNNGQYMWTVPATLTVSTTYEITVQPANVPLSYTGQSVAIKRSARFALVTRCAKNPSSTMVETYTEDNSRCEYPLTSTFACSVLNFKKLSIGSDDTIDVYNGNTTAAPLLQRLTSTAAVGTQIRVGPSILVVLTTSSTTVANKEIETEFFKCPEDATIITPTMYSSWSHNQAGGYQVTWRTAPKKNFSPYSIEIVGGTTKAMLATNVVVAATEIKNSYADTYSYTIPAEAITAAIPAGDYQIRLLNNIGALLTTSPVFKVSAAAQPISVSLSSAAIRAGDTVTISWNLGASISATANVDIDLYAGSAGSNIGTKFVRNIAKNRASAASAGSFTWTVLAEYALLQGNDYRVIIHQSDNAFVYGESTAITISDHPTTSISITAPLTNAVWFNGRSHTITWTTTDTTRTVDIQLYSGDVFVRNIATGILASSGTYSFFANGLERGYYRVLVRAVDTGAVFSRVENVLIAAESEPAAGLLVSSPTLARVVRMDEVIPVSWETTGAISTVKIDLFTAGKFVMNIANNLANTGSYSFSAPSSLIPGINYNIRVSSAENNNIFSESAMLSVIDTFSTTKVSVISPNAYSTLTVDTTTTITWIYTSDVNNRASTLVNIDLYVGNVWIQNIATNAANDGQYVWTVPNVGLAGFSGDQRFRIVVTPSYFLYGVPGVSQDFSIAPAVPGTFTCSVATPTGSSVVVGSPYTLSWTINPNPTPVRIDLYARDWERGQKDNFVLTVAENVPPSTYKYTLPWNLIQTKLASPVTDGTEYFLRVTTLTDAAITCTTTLFPVYVPQQIYEHDRFAVSANTSNWAGMPYLDDDTLAWVVENRYNTCFWMAFEKFDTAASDNLVVYDGRTTADSLDTLVGTWPRGASPVQTLPAPIESSDKYMFALWRTNNANRNQGFIARTYTPIYLDAEKGTFELTADQYIDNLGISWLIRPTSSDNDRKCLMVWFTRMDIAPADQLTIYDGVNYNANALKTLNGDNIPDSFVSTGSSLYVSFRSQYKVPPTNPIRAWQGFRGHYNFYPCAPTISVAVSSAYTIGSTGTVSWTIAGNVALVKNVNIDIVNNNDDIIRVASNVPASPSIRSIVVPEHLVPATDYRIVVSSVDDYTVSGQSVNVALRGSFTFTNPAPGTTVEWATNGTHRVEWLYTGLTDSITLQLVNRRTNSAIPIATGNTGVRAVDVQSEGIAPGRYFVRLLASNYITTSGGDVVVVNLTPGLTITSKFFYPFYVGAMYTIAYTATGRITAVDANVYSAGVLVRNITSQMENTGSFEFNVPADLTPGVNYELRLSGQEPGSSIVYSDSIYFVAVTACSHVITTQTSGNISHALTTHSSYSLKQSTCTWSVSNPCGSAMRLAVNRAGLSTDRVYVYDGADTSARLLADITGSFTTPRFFSTSGSRLLVVYKSQTGSSPNTFFEGAFSSISCVNNVVSITAPTRFTRLAVNTPFTVSWKSLSTTVPANVAVYLVSSTNVTTTLSSNAANTGSITGVQIGAAGTYYIRLTSVDNAEHIYDTSSALLVAASAPAASPYTVTVSASELVAGRTYQVNFTKPTPSEAVNVELYANGVFHSRLAVRTTASPLNWKVDKYQYLKDVAYTVMIVSASDSSVFTESAPFSIVEPAPTQSFDNLAYFVGTSYEFDHSMPWTAPLVQRRRYTIAFRVTVPASQERASSEYNFVNVHLYSANRFLYTIASNIVVNNELNKIEWVVATAGGADLAPGNTYRIVIADSRGHHIYTSTQTFTVSPAYVAPSISVSAPLEGSSFDKNTTALLQWTSTGFMPYVDIKLAARGVVRSVIATSVHNEGQYRWTVPDGLVDRSDYSIVVTSALVNEHYGNSSYTGASKNFRIGGTINPNITSSLTIEAPREGSMFAQYGSMQIGWTYTGRARVAVFDLISEVSTTTTVGNTTVTNTNRTFVANISPEEIGAVTGMNSLTFVVPGTVPAGENYKVRARWIDDDSVEALSGFIRIIPGNPTPSESVPPTPASASVSVPDSLVMMAVSSVMAFIAQFN